MEKINTFCQQLIDQDTPQPHITHVHDHIQILTSVHEANEPLQEVTIDRQDIINLINFTLIWTDIIETESVHKKLSESTQPLDIQQFESINHLYNIGTFYVRINPEVPLIEFLGLVSKIPWESMYLPQMNQISCVSITELFNQQMETHEIIAEQVTIQLMVLGDHFKLWKLINPHTLLKQSSHLIKCLLAEMGNFMIYLSPKFITDCKKLVEHMVNITPVSNKTPFGN
jgi:hypothetical protein